MPGALSRHARDAAVTGTDLRWTASRNDLEREINAEKARTDLRGNPGGVGDDLKTEERRLAERLSKLRLDMHIMAGDGSCQVRRLPHVSEGLAPAEACSRCTRLCIRFPQLPSVPRRRPKSSSRHVFAVVRLKLPCSHRYGFTYPYP